MDWTIIKLEIGEVVFNIEKFLWKNTLCRIGKHNGVYYCGYCGKNVLVDGRKILHFLSSLCVLQEGVGKEARCWLMFRGRKLTEIAPDDDRMLLDILGDYIGKKGVEV